MVAKPPTRTQQKVTELEKRVNAAMDEQRVLQQKQRDKTEKLRALRLAKEEAEAAEKEAARLAAPPRKKPASRPRTRAAAAKS